MPFDANDPETKAALKAAIDDAMSPILAKRDELLGEVKDLKTKLRGATEIKPEDLTALETENDRLKADLGKAQKEAKDAAKIAETASKQLEGESAFTRKLLVENGLRAELAAAGVTNPVHQKAAIAMHAGGVEIVTNGDSRVAKVGDKALADFVKEWASGDEGKHFVAAQINGGGGAGGGNGGGVTGKVITNDQFKAMNPVERAKFFETPGAAIQDAA